MKGKGTMRPSPAMIVACLALFVALGSGTYAAVKLKLKPNQVKAKNIRTGAVTEPKIATNAVTGPKIAANAVTEPKIAANAVTTGKIADAAVTGPKLGANSVDATKIAAGAVTKAKFAASGTATNTTTYTLNNSCTLDTTFAAPGVQPGDVVAYSFSETVPAGILSAAPGDATAGAGVIQVVICENIAVAANVTPGSLKLDWVAIR